MNNFNKLYFLWDSFLLTCNDICIALLVHRILCTKSAMQMPLQMSKKLDFTFKLAKIVDPEI